MYAVLHLCYSLLTPVHSVLLYFVTPVTPCYICVLSVTSVHLVIHQCSQCYTCVLSITPCVFSFTPVYSLLHLCTQCLTPVESVLHLCIQCYCTLLHLFTPHVTLVYSSVTPCALSDTPVALSVSVPVLHSQCYTCALSDTWVFSVLHLLSPLSLGENAWGPVVSLGPHSPPQGCMSAWPSQ